MGTFYREQCRGGGRHEFDYYSGWCSKGCNVRDDGRVVNRYGVVLSEGPEYTIDELTTFRELHARRSR